VLRRYLSGVVSFVVTATAGVAIFAAPAQAAAIGWPQDTTVVKNTYIQSAPDGSVVAANCSQASTAIKVFSPDGATAADVPQRTDGVYTKSCYGQGAIGKDGTVFGIAEDNYTKFAAVAYRGNTKLWERAFPHYCAILRQTVQRAIHRVLVGADGFVYVVTVPHTCFSGYYVSKLNASTGQVVFEKQLSTSATTFVEATSRGLVAQNTQRVIRYLKYDGTEFAPSVTSVGWMYSADMNGRAFTADTSSDACSTSILKMYTPGTATPFNFTVPQCWRITRVTATSQNGLAMLAYNQDGRPTLTSYTPKTGGGFNAASVVLPDTDSYRNFKSSAVYGTYNYTNIQTDTNGNILLMRAYTWQRGDSMLTGWQFTLQAANLNVVSEYDTGAFDFQQTNRFARMMHWAMAKDKLYISIGYCTNIDPYQQCGTQSVTLYVARMARLGVDYPRGTILGVTATTVTCKPVTFVGVRGSGEDPFAYEGLGEPVQDVKNRLVAAGLTNMDVVAVAYPATGADYLSGTYPPDYRDSVADGIDAVNATLIQINRDCPLTQIVVITYSQGAHATDGVRFLPTAVQNQIKAMVLLGDPLFNPALTTINKGTFSANLYGVWVTPGPEALPARQFSTNMTSKVASYCLAGDPVCNFWAPALLYCKDNPSTCPHVQYKPNWTQQAATWVRGKVTL
jgi:acetylxylan esterase